MIRNLAVVATVAAEALLLYVIATWIGAAYADDKTVVNGFLFVAAALVAFGVMRLSDELDLSGGAAAGLVAVVAFVVLYGSLRLTFAGDFALWDFGWITDFMDHSQETLRSNSDVIPGTVLLTTAWVRGAYRANTEVELDMVPRSIGLPFIAVTLILILGAPTESAGEIARAGAAFYAVAVLALACSQLAMSGATFGDLRAGGITGVLLAGTVGATVVGVVIFGIVFGLLAETFGPALGRATEVILTIVLTPPAWVLQWLMGLLLSNAELPQVQEAVQNQIQNTDTTKEASKNNAELVSMFFLRIFALLIAVGVIAGIVAWFSRVRKRQRGRPEESVVSSVAGSFGEDASSFLRNLFRRKPAPLPPRGATEAERLYHQVLDRAEHEGEVREPGETPEEFAPRLRTAFRAPVTDDITAAFEESRYAGRSPDPARVAELERRWRESAR